MFWLIRSIVSLAVLLAIGGAIIYFLPYDTKLEVVGKIAGIVPESIKDETEEIFFTPSESRGKILTKLEENFEALKDATPGKVEDLVSDSQAMLEKLKEKNEEQSIAELARQRIVDLLVNPKGTTTDCR